jgi:hypothetical protein
MIYGSEGIRNSQPAQIAIMIPKTTAKARAKEIQCRNAPYNLYTLSHLPSCSTHHIQTHAKSRKIKSTKQSRKEAASQKRDLPSPNPTPPNLSNPFNPHTKSTHNLKINHIPPIKNPLRLLQMIRDPCPIQSLISLSSI